MNMHLYVVGCFGEHAKVRAAIDRLIAAGNTITHDWTRSQQFAEDSEHPRTLDQLTKAEANVVAMQDVGGVWAADALVVLPHEDLYGGMVEIGLALAHSVEVWLVGEVDRESVFFFLPLVRRFEDLDAVISHIRSMN